MSRFLTLALLIVLVASICHSQKIIRVPQDQSTVQAGINAAITGDTVLVAEGIYHENIRFHGKKIVIASLFIIDNDTAHISKTILDGGVPSHSDSASVVTFDAGTDSVSEICGFTIQGGKE
jgi:hypothetical protein